MNQTTTPHPSWIKRLALGALGAGMCVGAAFAQTAGATVEAHAQARYQLEMARCNTGQSQQDTDTCRREAVNALAEARRGGLTTAPADPANSNAVQRCSALPADQRSDCMSRMTEGATVGSVASGGILREHVTVIPAK